MQEIGFTLDGISKGLRPFENTITNREELVECYNIVPRPQGLVAPESIQSLITHTVDWPFPQLFLGISHWLLCTRTKIYRVNGDWSLTEELTVVEGGVWHFADFFDYGILCNGTVTVVYNTVTDVWELCDGTLVPNLSTVCNYNGQILGAQSNTFLWGAIGAADFVIDQSNVKGRRPMPWFGEIYRIIPLGSGLVIYGSNGIAIVKFKDVVPGVVKVLKYGIASRGAVSGDGELHTFVDTTGSLRQISADFNVSSPNQFKEYFEEMLGSEIVVNMNSHNGDFYISNGIIGFVKTSQGLGEVLNLPSGLDTIGGQLIGVGSTVNDTTVLLKTDSMDFGTRSQKTIDVIEVGVIGTGDFDVHVDYKNEKDQAFQSTDWVRLNAEGIVTLPISGVEFRVSVRGSSYVGVKLSYIIVRVKMDDKRANRGISNAGKVTA